MATQLKSTKLKDYIQNTDVSSVITDLRFKTTGDDQYVEIKKYENKIQFELSDGTQLSIGSVVGTAVSSEYSTSATYSTNAGNANFANGATSANFTYELCSNASIVNDLSSAISTKIFIKNPDNTELEKGAYGRDLSVIKLPIDEYELSVIGETLSDNILYIVDSDYVDMYGQELCALSTSGVEGTSIGANTLYVNQEVQKVDEKFADYTATNQLSTFLSNHLTDFFSKVTIIGKDKDGNDRTFELLSCKLAF